MIANIENATFHSLFTARVMTPQIGVKREFKDEMFNSIEHRVTRRVLSGILFVHLLVNVRPVQNNCKVNEAQKCFRKVIQSAGEISEVNCTFYHRFKSCYLFPGCSELETASAASVAYMSITGVFLPKELFLAVMMSWSNICINDWCHRIMNITEQKIDLAMLDEIALLNRKVFLGTMTSTAACYRLKRTLTAWYHFRTTYCPFYQPECFCFELVGEVAHWCNLRCSYLLNSSNINSKGTLTIYAVLLLVAVFYR
ncbi:hypothetical protein TTRE_0000135701 [Trichuris trichiura]|uniref:Uncharacterized protein n=1 Tax=Trichuris trichiura TaxID=36087 RepID=A0A077YZA3_TRITR|nr:hypothetical protein TTRE_0000135701 [Trichuris trichiura]